MLSKPLMLTNVVVIITGYIQFNHPVVILQDVCKMFVHNMGFPQHPLLFEARCILPPLKTISYSTYRAVMGTTLFDIKGAVRYYRSFLKSKQMTLKIILRIFNITYL